MRALPLPFVAPVRGVTHYAENVSKARAGDPVVVQREPDNPYDPCACKVVVAGETVGYLPRELGRRLCLREEDAWAGEVHQVLVGDFGVGLRIQVRDEATEDFKAEELEHDTPSHAEADSPSRSFEQSVLALSGRALGALDGRDGDTVWVLTPAGQRVAYPVHLVEVSARTSPGPLSTPGREPAATAP